MLQNARRRGKIMPKITHFVPNTEDNLHCLQACFMMIYNTIFEKAITMEEAEALTGHVPDMPTWQYQAITSFVKRGVEVKMVESFPVQAFLKDPITTIKDHFKEEKLVRYILDNTDADKEVDRLQQAIGTNKVEFIEVVPTIEDIVKLLAEGYFILCNVSAPGLRGDFESYSGHVVIVEEVTSEHVLIQNPGLPPQENQRVPLEIFNRAWAGEHGNSSDILAVRKL
jgi:hypothetical protein